MTSTQAEESLKESSILRTDRRQRVWVPRERREAILEEFDKSGASAMRFAAYAGLKYSTFANWVARRKQKAGTAGEMRSSEPKWLEAIVDESDSKAAPKNSTLRVQFPGGAYVDIGTAEQVKLAAQLLASL
jgi:hypothetical protein